MGWMPKRKGGLKESAIPYEEREIFHQREVVPSDIVEAIVPRRGNFGHAYSDASWSWSSPSLAMLSYSATSCGLSTSPHCPSVPKVLMLSSFPASSRPASAGTKQLEKL